MLPYQDDPFQHITFDPEPRRFDAEVVYELIEENVREALAGAPAGLEVGIEVPLMDGSRLAVESFGYHNPGFILVSGIDSKTGGAVEALISHMSIQVLLRWRARQAEEPRREIGFLANRGQREAAP